MKVRFHSGNMVVLELGEERVRLIRCVDRYQQGNLVRGDEQVEIWEDEQGRTYRLSRSSSPGVPWQVHRWA